MNKYLSRYSNQTINNIKVLGIEMVQKANSGHPGIVLGAAAIMYSLFRNHLNVDLNDLQSPLRDRFVLSAGHGSALLYATMYLAGYKSLSLDDLKNFRQINSKTPGHPEKHLLQGVECSTGPLGQGVANAVGFALAESYASNSYKLKNKKIFGNYTYCLFGDGCMQEGIFDEAISIAGRYNLNKLILLYDSNDIQLDGAVKDSTKINTKKYFESKNFHYILVKKGHDVEQISLAIEKAKTSKDKPTIIEIKTIIGSGSINENSSKVHGAALSNEDISNIKKKFKFPDQTFYVFESSLNDFAPLHKRSEKLNKKYLNLKAQIYANKNENLDIINFLENKFIIPKWPSKIFESRNAMRNTCGMIINEFLKINKNILIINPDLSSSTKVYFHQSKPYDLNHLTGRNINVGVREFAMTAINTAIASYQGLRAIGATFMAFSDYCKPAIRCSAISKVNNILVFSHDSITVGEDGPTHQPIEQLWSLRLIPNYNVFRPANVEECIYALTYAFTKASGPTSIITSRVDFNYYKLPYGVYDTYDYGFQVINDIKNEDLAILATGSEVSLALDVAKVLKDKYNLNSKIISVLNFNQLDNNLDKLAKQIKSKSFAIEYGATAPWYKYVQNPIGLDMFGLSGKSEDIISKYELSAEDITKYISKFF